MIEAEYAESDYRAAARSVMTREVLHEIRTAVG